MAEGGRSTPSFHTIQSPKVGGCASAFFQLFERNSSKRLSLTSKRLPADAGGDKFSRRGMILKPEEYHPAAAVPGAAAQLLSDKEENRKGFAMPAKNAMTSSDSGAPTVACNKRVPGVVARLMGLESLPSGIIYRPRSSKTKSISVDTGVKSSYTEERHDDEHSKSPAMMMMMLQELVTHDLKNSKQSLKAKHPGFGKKPAVGQQQQQERRDPGKDARQKKSSLGRSSKEELSLHQSSTGAWDIVQQQQQQPPLPERKDEKLSIVPSSSHRSSSPCQLGPAALLPSKSHNQIIASPLKSPSSNKGTARLLEAAAKILEPNMQPCIRPRPSSSSSHGRKPPPPPPPIVQSVVRDAHSKNGMSSRGERVVVASETAARKVRNSGCSSASLSKLSINKDLRGQSMSRTWNGREDKEVNSARVGPSQLNGGSVSFRESCRYDHHRAGRGRRVDCAALGNQIRSLSPPLDGRRCNKAISTKTGDSAEVKRPSAIFKTKDAVVASSVQKSKAELRINSSGCSTKASEKPFATASSSSTTTPDEGNSRHRARSSMSRFSFGNQETSTSTSTSTTGFADFTEVPEPISPQIPVPPVPSSISPNKTLPPSNARNGKADHRQPIEHLVVVPSVQNTLLASSEFPSQSTNKSRSKHEVLTRDLQQQQQQPSQTLLASPVQETISFQTVLAPDNRKPAPKDTGKCAPRVLSEKIVKLDKEVVFPKHRVFPASESASTKVDSLSSHEAQPQGHQQGCAILETPKGARRKPAAAAGMRMISYSRLLGVDIDRDRTAAAGKKAVVLPKGAEITARSVLRQQSTPPRAPPRCSAKSIADTMLAVDPKVALLKATKMSVTPETDQYNEIPDQLLLLETQEGRAAAEALNQNSPMEFNGGCSTESPTDGNSNRFRESTVDTAVSSVKIESQRSEGSSRVIPLHTLRTESIDEVFPEHPIDSDVTVCLLAHMRTGDHAASFSCPQKEPKMQLSTECSDDLLRLDNETQQWRRSPSLMGSISESQAHTDMVDSPHDQSVSGESLDTGAWSIAVAVDSTDCTPERREHTLSSSITPSTRGEEEEQEDGLMPILMKWFSERNNGSVMGIGEGEQPSPVSILDSPFHDEVSTTPEPSLAESERHDEVLELHNTSCVVGILPSSELDRIDVAKASDAQQESSMCGEVSLNLPEAEIAGIRENEKIRQAMLEISKFQTADLQCGRLGKSQPTRADEEQSFVHGILKAAQFLLHDNEDSSLKWFAPGLPLDPSLFDRLESGDTEQINNIGGGGGGDGDDANLNLAQMSAHCQHGALWRCDRKLLFDSMNEALITQIGCREEPKHPWVNNNNNILVVSDPALRPPSGGCSNKLVEDVYGTISKWRELASNAIDSLIDMDMNNKCRLGSEWRYYEHEIRDVSLEIASMLLGMIIDEFVTDLAAAATSQLENWQAFITP